jgi:hypothetical protein
MNKRLSVFPADPILVVGYILEIPLALVTYLLFYKIIKIL